MEGSLVSMNCEVCKGPGSVAHKMGTNPDTGEAKWVKIGSPLIKVGRDEKTGRKIYKHRACLGGIR